jgi:hypothetical protein
VKRSRAFAAALATLAFLLSALPAIGAGGGTINATITPVDSCITVAPESVDLGPANFSALLLVTKHIPTQVVSCSSMSQDIYARGTHATGAGGAQWQIESSFPLGCPANVDRYRLLVEHPGDTYPPSGTSVELNVGDQKVAVLGPAATSNNAITTPTTLVMPCSGSSGAGVEMSFSITFTATLFQA